MQSTGFLTRRLQDGSPDSGKSQPSHALPVESNGLDRIGGFTPSFFLEEAAHSLSRAAELSAHYSYPQELTDLIDKIRRATVYAKSQIEKYPRRTA